MLSSFINYMRENLEPKVTADGSADRNGVLGMFYKKII